MKKSLFFVALGAIALTSCKKDDSIVNPENNTQQTGELISLQMGNPLSIETVTRSTGAVGDTVSESNNQNVWMGEKLRVFMLETGNLTPADESYRVESTDKYGSVTQVPGADEDPTTVHLFYNTEVTAPTLETSGAADYGYENKYYPATGTYDFFAYHADDAVNYGAEPDSATNAETKVGTIKVDVKINGSQDLMVAKAALTDAQLEDLEDPNADPMVDDEKGNMYYSAYAARRDIQPNFKFNHLLSRFVFNVTPGQEEATGTTGIRIDTIYVLDVKNEAEMTVASTADIYTEIDVDNFLTWGANKENMYLQQRGEGRVMEELEPAYLEWKDGKAVKQTIGESLLLPAGETSYQLVIAYSERPNSNAAITDGDQYQAAYEAAKEAAYDAAKLVAFEAAKAEALAQDYDDAELAAKAAAELAAKAAAKLAAYNAAKAAGEVNSTTSVDDWTWADEATWTWTEEATWEWSDEEIASWTANWTWIVDGVEQTVENWKWMEESTEVTLANWIWDGEADWMASFEAYKNRVYKSWVKAELKLPNDAEFQAGSQYNVNFKVWNMEKIELTMELTGWRSEADLNFDNDSPFVPIVVDYEQIAGDISGSTDGFGDDE